MNKSHITRSDQPSVLIITRNLEDDNSDLQALDCYDFSVSFITPDMNVMSIARDRDNVSCVLISEQVSNQQKDEIIKSLRSESSIIDIPILVLFDDDNSEDISKLLEVGCSRAIHSDRKENLLRSYISVAIGEYVLLCKLRAELNMRSNAIGQIVSGTFKFSTREEAQHLASLLSVTSPEPVAIAVGLAELLINSVEHGCLGISHDEKGQLVQEGRMADEIESRSKDGRYADKFVLIDFNRTEEQLVFVITDPGDGFDHESFLEKEADISEKHGRGISMARACFSRIEYNRAGNQVTASYSLNSSRA